MQPTTITSPRILAIQVKLERLQSKSYRWGANVMAFCQLGRKNDALHYIETTVENARSRAWSYAEDIIKSGEADPMLVSHVQGIRDYIALLKQEAYIIRNHTAIDPKGIGDWPLPKLANRRAIRKMVTAAAKLRAAEEAGAPARAIAAMQARFNALKSNVRN